MTFEQFWVISLPRVSAQWAEGQLATDLGEAGRGVTPDFRTPRARSDHPPQVLRGTSLGSQDSPEVINKWMSLRLLLWCRESCKLADRPSLEPKKIVSVTCDKAML